jgi:hypothetical protein
MPADPSGDSNVSIGLRCPRCGDALEAVADEVTCRQGKMGLSQVVWSELQAIAQSAPSTPDAAEIRWGGRWHCPVDGTRMVEADGRVGCPVCQRHLPGRVLYALIEFHPHVKTRRR